MHFEIEIAGVSEVTEEDPGFDTRPCEVYTDIKSFKQRVDKILHADRGRKKEEADEISSDEEQVLILSQQGLQSFQQVDISNFPKLINYLYSQKDEPAFLISETGGETDSQVENCLTVSNIPNLPFKMLEFILSNGSISMMSIQGKWELPFADMINFFGQFTKESHPDYQIDIYTFNEDQKAGKYRLLYTHWLRWDQERREEKIKVNKLSIVFL